MGLSLQIKIIIKDVFYLPKAPLNLLVEFDNGFSGLITSLLKECARLLNKQFYCYINTGINSQFFLIVKIGTLVL